MYCSNCGKQQNQKARFCSDCGEKLDSRKADSSHNQHNQQIKNAQNYALAGLIIGIFIPLVGWLLAILSLNTLNSVPVNQDTVAKLRSARSDAWAVFLVVSLVALIWIGVFSI